ncbi:hypothetical protein Tco_0209455 [Tanacetum coccineum]
MTGNRSYITDYEEINGGFVAFGGNSNGGRITGKCKIRTDFKLTDESHVLLKVPRKDNMYSVDLKNVVPQGGLTCLFAKSIPDESNLWYKRLGHVTKSLQRYSHLRWCSKRILGVVQPTNRRVYVMFDNKGDAYQWSGVSQFWTSAKSKTINNVRHITAKVAGKVVSISEASIRTDLIFDDADGIDTLPNQAIFNAIQLMGYEGDLSVLTFNKALFSPQWRLDQKDQKNAKLSSKHFQEYLKITSLNKDSQRRASPRNEGCTNKNVSKQGRKNAKGKSSVQRDPMFEVLAEDKNDHMETENAQTEGRTRDYGDERRSLTKK